MGRLTACCCFVCLLGLKCELVLRKRVIDRATVTMELFGEVRGGGAI